MVPPTPPNCQNPDFEAYLFDPETAAHWLAVLQPIQVGYGAVLLSFLGAIHWGLEFAGMGGHLVYLPCYVCVLTTGIPSVFLGYSCACVGLAYNPSSHQLCSCHSIPWIHRDVFCRLARFTKWMGYVPPPRVLSLLVMVVMVVDE
jgi:hypothetical protein